MSKLAPAVFVLIWSTGFLVARAVAPYADPILFLLVRFLLVAACFAGFCVATGVVWPAPRQWPAHLLAGALLQGVYLCAGWWAVGQGIGVGPMTLIGGLQPPLTVVAAQWLFEERASRRTLTGLALGLTGVALVMWPKLSGGADGLSIGVVSAALLSVGALTAGTLFQKSRLGGAHLAASSALQNVGAAAVAASLLAARPQPQWTSSTPVLLALTWSVLGLSCGGTTLLLWQVRRGSAAQATSLLYLVPPVAAAVAWLVFSEAFLPIQMAGMAVALAGVLLTRAGSASAVPTIPSRVRV